MKKLKKMIIAATIAGTAVCAVPAATLPLNVIAAEADLEKNRPHNIFVSKADPVIVEVDKIYAKEGEKVHLKVNAENNDEYSYLESISIYNKNSWDEIQRINFPRKNYSTLDQSWEGDIIMPDHPITIWIHCTKYKPATISNYLFKDYVTITVRQSNGGKVSSNLEGRVLRSEKLHLLAEPDPGYKFAGWLLRNESLNNNCMNDNGMPYSNDITYDLSNYDLSDSDLLAEAVFVKVTEYNPEKKHKIYGTNQWEEAEEGKEIDLTPGPNKSRTISIVRESDGADVTGELLGLDYDGRNFAQKFFMPDYDIIIEFPSQSSSYTPEKSSSAFDDVSDKNSAFYDAINWASGNSITTGVTDTMFYPDDTVTRGQMAAFLWRYAGKPNTVSVDNDKLTDVKEDSVFYDAINWALKNGITTGFDDNTFRQDEKCTRGQIVTFLWRYAGKPENKNEAIAFNDVKKDGNVFYDAIYWAADEGITTGFDDNTFRQDDDCTRGQGVTFLNRYDLKYNGI